jgi:hypothetical protein
MHNESVRLQVLRYLLCSSQKFRDAARGVQATTIARDLDWCDASLLTIARSLSYWQSEVGIAPPSAAVQAQRKRKAAAWSKRHPHTLARRENETQEKFRERVIATLPEDLQNEVRFTENGVEHEDDNERPRFTNHTAS